MMKEELKRVVEKRLYRVVRKLVERRKMASEYDDCPRERGAAREAEEMAYVVLEVAGYSDDEISEMVRKAYKDAEESA